MLIGGALRDTVAKAGGLTGTSGGLHGVARRFRPHAATRGAWAQSGTMVPRGRTAAVGAVCGSTGLLDPVQSPGRRSWRGWSTPRPRRSRCPGRARGGAVLDVQAVPVHFPHHHGGRLGHRGIPADLIVHAVLANLGAGPITGKPNHHISCAAVRPVSGDSVEKSPRCATPASRRKGLQPLYRPPYLGPNSPNHSLAANVTADA